MAFVSVPVPDEQVYRLRPYPDTGPLSVLRNGGQRSRAPDTVGGQDLPLRVKRRTRSGAQFAGDSVGDIHQNGVKPFALSSHHHNPPPKAPLDRGSSGDPFGALVDSVTEAFRRAADSVAEGDSGFLQEEEDPKWSRITLTQGPKSLKPRVQESPYLPLLNLKRRTKKSKIDLNLASSADTLTQVLSPSTLILMISPLDLISWNCRGALKKEWLGQLRRLSTASTLPSSSLHHHSMAHRLPHGFFPICAFASVKHLPP